VLDLVIRQQLPVAPLYVLDLDRPSIDAELAAMSRIRAALQAMNPQAARRLSEVRLLEKLAGDDEYQLAWERICRHHSLGTQYHWLPRSLAAAGVLVSELGILRDGRVDRAIGGCVVDGPDGPRVDAEIDTDLHVLFSSFRFPLLTLTKLRIGEAAVASGFAELMEMSWFCHTPSARGRPCGVCNPCRYTREGGLGRRIPRSYRVRHRVRATYVVSRRTAGKIKRRLVG
jgi:hypothetical protein